MKATKPATTKPNGLIYVFTGPGKGKTSAALGTAVRAYSHGWNVDWVAFYKEASWGLSEYALPELLNPENSQRFRMYALGKGFFIEHPETEIATEGYTLKTASVHHSKVVDTATPTEHHSAAQAALQHARTLLSQQPHLLVLDEICNALDDGLVEFELLESLLRERGKTHIVLTGRNAPPALIELADLVTHMQHIKHPYDQGVLAVAGLDF